MTHDPEGNLTAPAQGPVAEWAARELAEAEKSPEYWREMARLYRDDCADLQARLSQALEERDAWKQRFEDDAHDFHEMSEQLNAALEAARVAEAKAALLPDLQCFRRYEHEPHVTRAFIAGKEGHYYCVGKAWDPDALIPAADAAEGGKGA